MPQKDIMDKAKPICDMTLSIIKAARPHAVNIDNTHLNHFQLFIQNIGKLDIMEAREISIGLYYIHEIFQKSQVRLFEKHVEKAFKALWGKTLDVSQLFTAKDELICVLAFMLAAKGPHGQDIPYNNTAYLHLYNFNFARPAATLAFFNRMEGNLLDFLEFQFPYNPEQIEQYTQQIFLAPDPIPQPQPQTDNAIAPDPKRIKLSDSPDLNTMNSILPTEFSISNQSTGLVLCAGYQGAPSTNTHAQPTQREIALNP